MPLIIACGHNDLIQVVKLLEEKAPAYNIEMKIAYDYDDAITYFEVVKDEDNKQCIKFVFNRAFGHMFLQSFLLSSNQGDYEINHEFQPKQYQEVVDKLLEIFNDFMK